MTPESRIFTWAGRIEEPRPFQETVLPRKIEDERQRKWKGEIFYCLAFRSLSLFEQWTDDALKNVCFEAQIQEVRNILIIITDSWHKSGSKKERDLMFFSSISSGKQIK